MSRTLASRASAVFVACVTAVAFAPPVSADPMDPIPGNGIFVVGPDIAPGLYHTAGSASGFGVWINNVPTQSSMCAWFTYGTPDANARPIAGRTSSGRSIVSPSPPNACITLS